MRKTLFSVACWILGGIWSLLAAILPAVPAQATDAQSAEPPGSSATLPVDAPQAWTLEPADPDLLAEVVRQGNLRGGHPSPSLAHYFRDLFAAAFKPLMDWFESFGGPLGAGFAWFASGGWWVLVIFLVALVVILVALQLRRVLRGRVQPVVDRQPVLARPTPASEVAAWEERLERRLDRGDARGALEALWWSLAVRLMGSKAEPAWTSRELVDRAGRRDLLPSMRLLDRWVWGGHPPGVEDVRQLWGRLREVAG